MKRPSILVYLFSAIFFLLGIEACDTTSPQDPKVEETYKHERPTWSPNGLKIAFTVRVADSAGVYIVDSTGANLRMVKTGAGIGITWSPDSKWLACSVSGSLFKIKENGDSLTQLTNNTNDYRPSWSPDGKRIVYWNNGVRIFNIADSSIMNIDPEGDYPAWHPNSTELLYIFQEPLGNETYFVQFRSFNLADSSGAVVVPFTADALAAFASYNQAADEIVLSLSSADHTALSQIVKFSLSTLEFSTLTGDGGDYPSWSPDGSKIVYMRSAKDDGGLWIMNSDGSGKHRLTTP